MCQIKKEMSAESGSPCSLAEVRRAVAEAVEEFQRREALPEEEDARSATSSTPSSPASVDLDEASTDGEESSPAAEDSAFELELFGDLSSDLYYASLAQAMLMEPPSTVTAFCDDAVAEVPLWSY
ncbi:dehydration-responsive element-binding protein 1A-like [Panicum miliaceum]|uniref:Dehydration-responsive element-binding protein 1A-like n=1 Tax=Panicum miliaceum TaxID=4540 RepID=A0A3L6TBE3_PANMI|nr:dehydration-responsive element-binding protein 1A-like [Panicum miliaceum]